MVHFLDNEPYARFQAAVAPVSAAVRLRARGRSGKPGAVFIVDPKYDKTALAEARKLKVPVVALSDSNEDPSKITHPIPANDDSLKSIELITGIIADAVIAGKEKANAAA